MAPKYRLYYPEFADATVFPDEIIERYFGFAELEVTDAWGDLRQLGKELYTAHYLALWGLQTKGIFSGSIQSKTVGPVSVSYTLIPYMRKPGFWNLTLYGMQYAERLHQLGAGVIQI